MYRCSRTLPGYDETKPRFQKKRTTPFRHRRKRSLRSCFVIEPSFPCVTQNSFSTKFLKHLDTRALYIYRLNWQTFGPRETYSAPPLSVGVWSRWSRIRHTPGAHRRQIFSVSLRLVVLGLSESFVGIFFSIFPRCNEDIREFRNNTTTTQQNSPANCRVTLTASFHRKFRLVGIVPSTIQTRESVFYNENRLSPIIRW